MYTIKFDRGDAVRLPSNATGTVVDYTTSPVDGQTRYVIKDERGVYLPYVEEQLNLVEKKEKEPSVSTGMTRKSILETALEIVSKDRNTDYGEPEDNFKDIAKMWSAYKDVEFKAYDVAAMMIMLKVSRLKTSPAKEDTWADIAGYAGCGGQAYSNVPEDW